MRSFSLFSAEVDAKMLVSGEDASSEAKVINEWLNVSVAEALKTGYATKVCLRNPK
jgi:hypothetical protein